MFTLTLVFICAKYKYDAGLVWYGTFVADLIILNHFIPLP
jgi:hypothetical protein